MGRQEVDAADFSHARRRWIEAREIALKLSEDMFSVGSGFGDPDAREAARHQVETATREIEWRHQELLDLERRDLEARMLRLQRSQTLATWASFAVAAAVGATTAISVLL